MNILHLSGDRSIAYHRYIALENKAPIIIFHHGFMSDMSGDKAIYIEQFCQQHDYDYIRFDNFGCGNSSGVFIDQTITSWLDGSSEVMRMLADRQVLLVGSSLGAWIAILTALRNPQQIAGIITIAAAFDFTEELWHDLSNEQKEHLNAGRICQVSASAAECSRSYPIHPNLINDAKHHLILSQEKIKNVSCPIHLIHGMQDLSIPYTISQNASMQIGQQHCVLKLIKDGNHTLSRNQDMRIICSSIQEILSYLGT